MQRRIKKSTSTGRSANQTFTFKEKKSNTRKTGIDQKEGIDLPKSTKTKHNASDEKDCNANEEPENKSDEDHEVTSDVERAIADHLNEEVKPFKLPDVNQSKVKLDLG